MEQNETVIEKYIVSSSPHLLKSESTRSIMWIVSLFLAPAAIFGVFAFGLHAFLVLLVSILFSMATEVVVMLIRKRSTATVLDGSAFLTGLLIGMNMPPNVPLYIPIISSIFAIGIVKQAFGGLGQNWANPAIAARVFALFAWSKHMTTWNKPFIYDAITTSTPLGAVKSSLMEGINGAISSPLNLLPADTGYFELFFGFKGGCIGEISAFLLLVGAAYLVYRRIITLDIPVSYLLTVVIIAFVFDGLRFGNGYFSGDFLFHLLTGGMLLGALFMATDMVTTPVTIKGRIIFGVGCGLITMLVRMVGGLPEGVSLAILFMNMLTPAIDRFVRVKPLGFVKQKTVKG
jgi:electron transport complex protein RnfD